MRLLILALLAILAVAAPAAAESPAPSNTVAGEVPPKPPLKLTDEQKNKVAQAINGQDTLAKLPAGFTPAIGARAPSEDAVPEYPLPRPLVYEVPVLKQYYYAQLADQVLMSIR
jgi:hypothetical protein